MTTHQEKLFGPIEEAFQISGRGCIVVIVSADVSPDVVLNVGDRIALRTPSGERYESTVLGIEMGTRQVEKLGFLVGPEIDKQTMVSGTTVWKCE